MANYRFPYPHAATHKLLSQILIKVIPPPPYAITGSAVGATTAAPVIIGKRRGALAWGSPG